MPMLAVGRTRIRHPREAGRSSGRRRVALLVIVSCQLMVIVDSSIVNIALPSIQNSLHVSSTGLAWVVNAYLLPFGGLLLLGGRVGDMAGRRRVLVVGVAVFTAASLLGGFATSAGWLLAARALQGAAAAFAAPSTLSLIAATFAEGPARNRALGAFSTVAGLGLTVGMVLGGVLTSELSWRWVLFVNVPLGVAIVVLAPRFVNEPPRHAAGLDLPGALTSTLAMAASVYGFIRAASDGWGDATTIGAFVMAAVLLAAFVLIELRTAQPLIPLRLFASRNRAASYLNMLLFASSLQAVFFFLTQFLQRVLDLSALRAGLAVVPLAALQFAAARTAPRLVARFGPKPVTLAGSALLVGGLAWLTRLSPTSDYLADLLGPLLLFGTGVGLCFMPLNMLILAGVPREDSGAASGVLQTVQRVGGSIGIAVLTTVFGIAGRHAAAHAPADTPPRQLAHLVLARGVASAFTVSAVVGACTFVIAAVGLTAERPARR